MQSFRFEGTDSNGHLARGEVRATSADAAVRSLASQGVRLRSITPVNPPVASAPLASPAPVGAPPRSNPPIASPAALVAPPGATTANLASRKLFTFEWFNLFRVSHTDCDFFFSQAGRLLRAGINPAKVFLDLSQRHPHPQLREAAAAMAQSASAGRTVSEAMARYPKVFGPECVGAVYCGELGGYLPDAFGMLATQEEEARKLATQIRLSRWQLLVLAFLAILSLAWTAASKKFIDRAINDGSASAADNLTFLFSQAFAALAGPIGIVLGVAVVAYIVAALWGKDPRQRLLRHSLVLRIPIAKELAASESLSVFSDHLARLSAAGLSPSRAWAAASSACPNLAYALEMERAGERAEGVTLASLVDRSSLVPSEVRQLAATGEASGSIPDAMSQASRYAGENAANARKLFTLAWYGTALALSALAVVVALALFYRGWYGQMFDSVLGDVYGTEAE